MLRPLSCTLLLLAPLLAQSTPAPLQRTRAVWFGKGEPPIVAEVALSFEPLPWTQECVDAWDGPVGTRLPLGKLAWPELATFTELELGKTVVKPGAHVVVLERGAQGWTLAVLDSAKARAPQTPPGIATGTARFAALPLVESRAPHGPLRAAFVASDSGQIALELRWGERMLRGQFPVKGAADGQLHVQADPRHAVRHVFARGDGRELAAVLDHGVVPWTADLQKQAEALRPGQRWRLGRDWPTTFEVNTAVAIGGRRLPAGSWHVAAERTREGWSLAFANANETLRTRIDGSAPDALKPVLTVPLLPYEAAHAVDELRIGIDAADGKTRIVVTFGTTQVATTLAVAKG